MADDNQTMVELFNNIPIKELEEIINNKSSDYTPEAIDLAKSISEKRAEKIGSHQEGDEEVEDIPHLESPEYVKLLNDRIKLTTAPTLEGYKVIETLDVITAECVFGMNIFRDFFAGMSDFFGGRSKASQKVLRDSRILCLNELRMEAYKLGGNAVIAIDLDYSEISGKGKGMLFLVASGTAVKVEEIVENIKT
jgi:uncharacterized protein YbjQ (UPF0145 family)